MGISSGFSLSCSLPHRQLRKICDIRIKCSSSSLPHRQLRNVKVKIAQPQTRSLPHRQLRKPNEFAQSTQGRSLPHRPFENLLNHFFKFKVIEILLFFKFVYFSGKLQCKLNLTRESLVETIDVKRITREFEYENN